jgi:Uma2 family endonuclease
MTLTAEQFEALMPDASQLYSDEPEMESSLHSSQLMLLVSCLEWLWQDCTDFFIGANLTIYFSRQQLKNRDFRGPDFFLVKNTQKQDRNAWVVWEEDGKYPNLHLLIALSKKSYIKIASAPQNTFGFRQTPASLQVFGLLVTNMKRFQQMR